MAFEAPTLKLVSDALRSRLQMLRKSIERIYQNRLHTHFTDHSITHCDRVAAIAEELVKPLKTSLSNEEAFILYCGCYLHDIGMHNEKAGEIGRLAAKLAATNRDWNTISRDEVLDIIRRKHHEISADMVIASLGSGNPPTNFLFTDNDHPAEIATICEAHGVDTVSPRYIELHRSERSTMRLRLLSAILRLADVFDEAHHRAIVEQQHTLNLNLESRMHWWRHYYTREIEIEPQKNRITVWFDFPLASREQYAKLIPLLQMPWIEQELACHRSVLTENGLSWHIGWQIQDSAFDTIMQMPLEVESFMLQNLACSKQIAAKQSRIDLLKQFGQSTAQLNARLQALEATAETAKPEDYLSKVLPLTKDLWDVGSRVSALHWLRSALWFATTNGRTVPSNLHLFAACELAQMESLASGHRTAVSTLVTVRPQVDALTETEPEKLRFYRLLASVALAGGYFKDGEAAANKVMQIVGPGKERNVMEAELAEAKFLEGL